MADCRKPYLGNRTNVNLRSGSDEVYSVNTTTNRYNSIAGNSLTGACPGVFSAGNDAGNLTTDKDGQAKPAANGREHVEISRKNYIFRSRKTATTVYASSYELISLEKVASTFNSFP